MGSPPHPPPPAILSEDEDGNPVWICPLCMGPIPERLDKDGEPAGPDYAAHYWSEFGCTGGMAGAWGQFGPSLRK